jgi:thiamine pyrophosphate-dependent acetolactate synthase large subunit-like protein
VVDEGGGVMRSENVLFAIAAAVAAEGVDHVFHAPDEVSVFVAQALHENGIRIVRPRHEQNAILMADGYARATERVGVALVGDGPAIAQTGTGLVTALRRRSPVLVLMGQVPKNPGANKRFDARGYVESLGLPFLELRSARSALRDVREAFRLVRARRGPLVLGVGDPHLLFDDLSPSESAYEPVLEPAAPDIDSESDAIQDAAARLVHARRPVLVAGRGAIGARDALVSLADRIGALLATSIQARELFRGHPRDIGAIGTLGTTGAAELFVAADCIAGFGIALNPYQTVPSATTVIHVDSDREAIGRFTPVDVGIVGDAAAVARAIDRALETADVAGKGTWPAASISGARAEVPISDEADDSEGLAISAALARLDALLPDERYVVADAGLFLGFLIDRIAVPGPRSWMWTNDFGSIGLALAMGMGAACARPEAHVTIFAGDGGFMMSLQEIESAVRERIPLTVVVLNSGGHASEERFLAALDKPLDFSRFGDVDFAAVARAFGATGLTVASFADFAGVAEAVEGRHGPIVIDVKVREDEPHRLLEGGAITAARS